MKLFMGRLKNLRSTNIFNGQYCAKFETVFDTNLLQQCANCDKNNTDCDTLIN
jgi:hypothetical protein